MPDTVDYFKTIRTWANGGTIDVGLLKEALKDQLDALSVYADHEPAMLRTETADQIDYARDLYSRLQRAFSAPRELPGFGPATTCVAYKQHRPKAMRFVWHHVLPQACGGESTPENVISLCDNCHYAIHHLMYALRTVKGDTHKIIGWEHAGTREERHYAGVGYQRAVAAGTVDKIPNEG